MVTICYHMLPYATMVSRNSTWAPNFLGFRTQMNPVRSSHETHGPEVQEWYLAAWWGPWPRGQRLRGYILELSWLQKQWTIRSGRDFFQSVTSCFFWILICRPNGDLMGFNVDLSRFIDILLFERGSSFFLPFWRDESNIPTSSNQRSWAASSFWNFSTEAIALKPQSVKTA